MLWHLFVKKKNWYISIIFNCFFAVPQEWIGAKVNITEKDDDSNTSFDFVEMENTKLTSVEVKTETNSQRPIIYTTRLEDMSIFLQDFIHLTTKEINERIEQESKPLFENLNNKITDVELQRLFYTSMLEKLNIYKLNINNNADKLNGADEYRGVTTPDTKTLSEEKNKSEIDTSTREMKTAVSTKSRKSNSKNCAHSLHQTNDNVKIEYVTVISSDDDDDEIINLNELRISKKNRSLLNLCKPVSVVLQDIGRVFTGNQTKKCNNSKRVPTQFIAPNSKHLTIDKQLVHNILMSVAKKLQSAIEFSSMNTVLALSQLQPIAHSSGTSMDTTPLLSSPCYSQKTKTLLLPPEGFTWNPSGVYVVFRDLCTKATEAFFLDGIGRPKEFYKLDFKSSKEIEKFISSQRFMTLACCCWYRREAYIRCMSPQYVPVQTAQLFKKPHKCPIYKCTCCCKSLFSEFNEASSYKLNVTESEVGIANSDGKEDARKHTKEKPDYIQELLRTSHCINSNSLINKALRFDRNRKLNKVVQKPVAAESFQSRYSEIVSGLNNNAINSCPRSTKIHIKYTINGCNEIYIQDSIAKMTLHTIDFPKHSILENAICCWYKLQSLCEKFNVPLSIKNAKHSCAPEKCCCCCYKPEIKIEKSRFVDGHLPTRTRHSLLNLSEFELKEMYQSFNSTGPILASILSSPKDTSVKKDNVLSCPLKNTRSVLLQNYVDRVITDLVKTPEVKSKTIPKNTKSKNPPPYYGHHHITAESGEPCQTTPIITGVYSNTVNQTNDPICYPIITNVFSVAPQSADVPKVTSPIITGVFSDQQASTSTGPPQTCTIGPQEIVVESVINTVLETFKDVRLTINKDGKVAAALNTPIHKLNTTELKILGNILAHAQSEVENLKSRPGSNVGNSIQQLPLGALMNTINIPSSTAKTPITIPQVNQNTSLQCSQPLPVLLIPVISEPITQSIYKTFSAEMSQKVEDYSKSYSSFTTLKTALKNAQSTSQNAIGIKRKMEYFVPIKPKIRVISPTKLGAPRSNWNESGEVEDNKKSQSLNEPLTSQEDFESQLLCYAIPVRNQGTKQV